MHGESVNIAARLEQLNKQTGTRILMTQATAKAVGDRLDLHPVGVFEVRGVPQHLELFSTN